MDPKRVAELHDPHRSTGGTGYLIRENLILTAHHVIAPSGETGIIGTHYHMRLVGNYEAGKTDWIKQGCYLCWDNPQHDLALLKVKEDRLAFELNQQHTTCFGELVGTQVLAQGIGFPAIQEINGLQNPEELKGYLSRYSALKLGQLRLQVTSLTPNSPDQWQGISGAALFVGNFLVGVIVETNKSFAEKALWATPISAVANDAEFCELVLDEPNCPLLLETIEDRESSGQGQIKVSTYCYNSESYLLEKGLNRNKDVFTGREDILEAINNNFANHHIQVITALGGVGKTTTALEYAYRSIENQSYRSVFWVRADNEETLLSEFKCIAEALGLSVAQSVTDEDGESDQGVYKKAVFDWLKKEENGSWLLVYDNADDSNDQHRKRAQDWLLSTKSLPSGKHGRILITSRSDKWGNVEEGCCLELPYFELEDSLNFFEKRLERKIRDTSEEEPATKLTVELGHLPLALEQASAYMRDTTTSVGDYFQLFKELRLSLLDESVAGRGEYGRRNLEVREEEDRLVVGTTWTLNFNQVSKKNPAASELLEIAAFLNPDGIPLNIFFDGAHILGGEIAKAFQGKAEILAKKKMREMLSTLTSYSLIRWQGDKSESFDMHRLVQEVIRTYHVKDRELLLGNLLACLCRIIPFECSIWGISADWSLSDGTWSLFTKFFPHAQSVLRYAENQEELRISEPVFILYNFVADYLRERLLYQDAIAEGYLKAIAIGEQLPLETIQESAYVNIRLADVYRRTRKLDESLELLRGITEYAEQLQQTDHGFMKAFVLKDMARIYQNQGNHAKAEKLHLEALSIVESTLNSREAIRELSSTSVENNSDWVYFRGAILSSLGNCYRFWNRYHDAIEKLEEAGQIFAHTGQTHLGYLRNRYDLARAYQGIKDFQKARAIHLVVLKERRKNYGSDHPVTATSLSALGTLYRDWGKALKEDRKNFYMRKSLIYLLKAYQINQKYVGLSDPRIEPSLYNLCDIYQEINVKIEWKQILDEALNAYENHSDEFTHLGFVYRSLATYYQAVEDYDSAEKYFQMAIDKDKQLRPNDFRAICESLKLSGFFHKKRADAYKKRVDTYEKDGEIETARREKEAARKHYEFAASSLMDALSYKDLKGTTRASIYTSLGDLYKNLAKITDHSPEKDPDQPLDKYIYRKKAERNYSLALLANIKFWGRDNIYVARGFKGLGETYNAHNRYNQAEVVVQLALQTYSKLPETEQKAFSKEINYTRELLRRINNNRKRR